MINLTGSRNYIVNEIIGEIERTVNYSEFFLVGFLVSYFSVDIILGSKYTGFVVKLFSAVFYFAGSLCKYWINFGFHFQRNKERKA